MTTQLNNNMFYLRAETSSTMRSGWGSRIGTILQQGQAGALPETTYSGILVTGISAQDVAGTWQLSSDYGTSWRGLSTADGISGAVALSSDALLRFVPALGSTGGRPSLAFRALGESYAGPFANSAADTPLPTVNPSSPEYVGSASDGTATIGVTVIPDAVRVPVADLIRADIPELARASNALDVARLALQWVSDVSDWGNDNPNFYGKSADQIFYEYWLADNGGSWCGNQADFFTKVLHDLGVVQAFQIGLGEGGITHATVVVPQLEGDAYKFYIFDPYTATYFLEPSGGYADVQAIKQGNFESVSFPISRDLVGLGQIGWANTLHNAGVSGAEDVFVAGNKATNIGLTSAMLVDWVLGRNALIAAGYDPDANLFAQLLERPLIYDDGGPLGLDFATFALQTSAPQYESPYVSASNAGRTAYVRGSLGGTLDLWSLVPDVDASWTVGVDPGPGNARVEGGAEADWVNAAPGRHEISGGAGRDTLSYVLSRAGLTQGRLALDTGGELPAITLDDQAVVTIAGEADGSLLLTGVGRGAYFGTQHVDSVETLNFDTGSGLAGGRLTFSTDSIIPLLS